MERPPVLALLALLAPLGLALAGCGDDGADGGEGGAAGETTSTGTSTSTTGATTTSTSASTSTASSSATTSSSSGGGSCEPSTTPVVGEPCPSPGLTCEYGSSQTCPWGEIIALNQIFTCDEGTWRKRIETDRDCCPGPPPTSGTLECRHAGQRCSWPGEEVCAGGGGRQTALEAECDGEVWITTHDLGDEGCTLETTCPPDPPPLLGECGAPGACLYLRPSACPDGAGYDIMTYMNCQDGLWVGAALPEGTTCSACSDALPTCDPSLEGVVCEVEGGEGTCLDPTGWATGNVGPYRFHVKCGDGAWTAPTEMLGYTDCSG